MKYTIGKHELFRIQESLKEAKGSLQKNDLYEAYDIFLSKVYYKYYHIRYMTMYLYNLGIDPIDYLTDTLPAGCFYDVPISPRLLEGNGLTFNNTSIKVLQPYCICGQHNIEVIDLSNIIEVVDQAILDCKNLRVAIFDNAKAPTLPVFEDLFVDCPNIEEIVVYNSENLCKSLRILQASGLDFTMK